MSSQSEVQNSLYRVTLFLTAYLKNIAKSQNVLSWSVFEVYIYLL